MIGDNSLLDLAEPLFFVCQKKKEAIVPLKQSSL